MSAMTLYVYDTATNKVVATISGDDNAACEARAADLYSGDEYGWTYTPAFGFDGGLLANDAAIAVDVAQDSE